MTEKKTKEKKSKSKERKGEEKFNMRETGKEMQAKRKRYDTVMRKEVSEAEIKSKKRNRTINRKREKKERKNE